MKSTIVLYVLAVLYTVNAITLNSLLIKVRSAKWSVEKSMDQVNDLRNDVVQKIDFTIMQKWLIEIEKLNKYVERTLKTMDKEADKAKDENAQQCYDAAFSFITNSKYATYTHAQLCHECAKNSIKNNLDFIDDKVSAGRRLWLDLDNIFPNCYDSTSGISDILNLQKCIIDRLKICNDCVNDLKRDANSAKHNAKTAFDSVIEESNKCLYNAYSDSQSNITMAKEIFTRCLKTS